MRRASSTNSSHSRLSEGAHGSRDRALERDRLYQRTLQEQWFREAEARSPNHAKVRQTPAILSNIAAELEPALPHSLRGIELIEAEIMHALPVFTNSEPANFSAEETSTLREVLYVLARVSHPSLGLAPTRLFRPTFCRFLLDSGLVDCNTVTSPGAARYHQAVRHFDAIAQPTRDVDGGPASASIDDIVTLIANLLGDMVMSASATRRFCETGLTETRRLAQAIVKKQRDRADEMVVGNKTVTSARFWDQAATSDFSGTVADWSQGMKLWSSIVATQTTPDAIRERCEQEAAIDNYLADMLVEPGVLHTMEAFQDLFTRLFEAYADESRQRWDADGRPSRAKHLAFAGFFRFCVDFGVFPSLCSFDYAKEAYRESECLEDLGRPPQRVEVRTFANAVNKVKMIKAMTNNRRSSCPLLDPYISQQLKAPVDKIPFEKLVASLELTWVERRFDLMTEQQRRLYSLLCALGDCAADRFQSVKNLLAREEDESTAWLPSLGAVQRNTSDCVVDGKTLSSALEKLDITHCWSEQELVEILKTLAPESDGSLRTSDMDKAVRTVREDALKRLVPGRLAQLSPDPGRGSSSPGAIRLAALGEEARRLEVEESNWPCRIDLSKQGSAYGATAFTEALFRIGFRYLHGTASPAQAAMTAGPKAQWFIANLRVRYRRELSMFQAVREAPTNVDTGSSTLLKRPGSGNEPPRVPGSRDLPQFNVERRPSSSIAAGERPTLCLPAIAEASSNSARSSTGSSMREEPFPEGASYATKRARLFEEEPDLFEGLPWSLVGFSLGEEEDGTLCGSGTGPACKACGHRQCSMGVGSVHCHLCSGVDEMLLRESPLWLALSRRRLREGRGGSLEGDPGADTPSPNAGSTKSSLSCGGSLGFGTLAASAPALTKGRRRSIA